MARMVLCINAGSSSLKFAVYEKQQGRLSLRRGGAIENLGTKRSRAWSQDFATRARCQNFTEITGHAEAVRLMFGMLQDLDPELHAIGHRVVHGGSNYSAPTLVDDNVLNDLRDLIPFAPLHQPHAIAVIEAVAERFPQTPQVACFDTAVHRGMPEIAQRFPLPGWLWEEGVRRYGFHGLSYESLLDAHPELRHGRTVIAHLGHGASLAAFLDGQPQDTTMGFTPTGGLMMGTRCGDLDPGILLYLMERHGYGQQDIDRLVNHESGLKGVSGSTSDMEVLERQAETSETAALAIGLFCRSLCKHIGALAAVLGSLDRLVFTAGIGQHSALVRERVCRQLAFLGIELDDEHNGEHAREITRSGSRCVVYVLPTNEEQMIARQTLATLSM